MANLYGSVEGSNTKISFSDLWQRYIMNHLRRDFSKYPVVRAYNTYATENATMSGMDNICF